MNIFHLLPGCRVERICQIGSTGLQLEARGVRCPACGGWSETHHGSYQRRPADLPWLGRSVRVVLRVHRFRCHNAACARRTFAKRLPGLIADHARRTRRLAAAQSAVAVALGGEAGARLLPALALPTSADTLLRLVRQRPLPAGSTPTALGIDDRSFKRGTTYGTIFVYRETRRVVDLLPDRRAGTLAAWLRPRRRHVKIVARDRSTELARGVEMGAPRAVQVADRWHLLKNTREMLTRWLFGVYTRLRRLPAVAATCPPCRGGGGGTRAFPRENRAKDLGRQPGACAGPLRGGATASSGRRVAARHQKSHGAGTGHGAPLRPVPKASPNARCARRNQADPTPFIPWLEERLAAGCENASALYRQLRERGYPGSSRQVHRWVQTRRITPAKTTPPHRRDLPPISGQADASPLASPWQLAWLLLQPAAKLDMGQKATVAHLEQDREVRKAGALARRFTAPVQASGVTRRRASCARLAALTRWPSQASTCGVPALQSFAAGVQQDLASIQAALTSGWSNGQTEGHVNKLKLLKRQMYGRAKFALLRRRLLLAS